MSLTAEPNFQDYIERISNILSTSALLLPKSIGGDATATDLVNQVIENQLPIPNLSVDGPDPPYVFVTTSRTPIVLQEQKGRDSRDEQGPRRTTMEFYLVILSASNVGRQGSEAQANEIVSAVATTMGKNKRLTDPSTGLSPLAATTSYEIVPYIYDIQQNTTVAINVVVRVVVGVNLRS